MLQKEEQNDAPTLSIRPAMGMKKRSLSWSGAANHVMKTTHAQQLGV
jgi:hypothetical protein